MREIDIPGGGRGPYYVDEYEDLLLVSLKGGNQVLVINHTDPQQYWLYDAEEQPIFVTRHPQSGEFYASQDQANKILRIIRVTFDDGYTRILGEEVAVLPTQHCKAHRLLPLNTGVLVTELTSATVAQFGTEPQSLWDQPTSSTPGESS